VTLAVCLKSFLGIIEKKLLGAQIPFVMLMSCHAMDLAICTNIFFFFSVNIYLLRL